MSLTQLESSHPQLVLLQILRDSRCRNEKENSQEARRSERERKETVWMSGGEKREKRETVWVC